MGGRSRARGACWGEVHVRLARIGSLKEEAPPSPRRGCEGAGKWPQQQEKGMRHLRGQGQGGDCIRRKGSSTQPHRSEDKAWALSAKGLLVTLGKAISEAHGEKSWMTGSQVINKGRGGESVLGMSVLTKDSGCEWG